MTEKPSPDVRRQDRSERERRQRDGAATRAAAILRRESDVAEQVSTEKAMRDGVVATAIQWVALADIVDSPNQTRLADAAAKSAADLAADIAAIGLLSFPVVRIAPGRPGIYEVIAGHQRIAALRQLAGQPEVPPAAAAFFRPGAKGPKVPVLVRSADDRDAFRQTIAENDKRLDPSAWERGVAYHRYQQLMKAEGRPSSLEAVAAELGIEWSTMAPYLRTAERITDEVRMHAGLHPGRAGHEPLTRLSLQVLRRVAAPEDHDERARALKSACRAVMELESGAGGTRPKHARLRTTRAEGGSAVDRTRGFQLNIRVPLSEVAPRQAASYAARLVPLTRTLIEAGSEELDVATARDLMRQLRTAIDVLGRRADSRG